ncbi:Glycine transporter domain-containing protein [Sphingomonas antarctica]|uniref:trimeric intracellular cation channel family protein n=1 Tax=Sphingomonas antarctica TaxID=2040274 RepID=UPI0039EBFBC8
MNPPTVLMTQFLPLLDLFGIAVFAASGALAAARAGQTLVTFSFFALVTGVGGGTVRDLLIGVPVFWVHDWRVPAVCLGTAWLVWLTPARWWRGRALDWFDAVGLAVYASFGAAKALSAGVPVLPAMMMGVITACVGGIIRDLLAGTPSILLKPEIYVTAAALSAACFVALNVAGVRLDIAFLAAVVAGFTLRALAIARGLSIPSYRR